MARISMVVVDDFLVDPHAHVALARSLEYEADERYFKGLRSTTAHGWGFLPAFQQLLNRRITDWEQQPYNARFQMTDSTSPIVYHADNQDYAAALYLDEGIAPAGGTSFWRHRGSGGRRWPTEYSLEDVVDHDAWELVDRVAAVFNRLVLWDAKLLHSATSYPDPPAKRLVQLFFFSVE